MSETTTASTAANVQPTPSAQTSEPAVKAPETSETKPETITKPKYKVKVDGSELEVGEEDLITNYQKGVSADKRFKEAAELKKQLETFIENVKGNPEYLLEQMGINPYEFYQNKLLEKLERDSQEASLTPEQKKIRELESRLEKREREEKELAERRAQEMQAQEEARIINSLDEEIAASFSEMGIKKPTAEMVADLAEQMLVEYKASKKQLSAKEAISRSKSSFQKRLSAWTNESPERVLDLIPANYLEVIAQAYLNKKTGAQVPSVKSQTPATRNDSNKNNTLNDFFKKGY